MKKLTLDLEALAVATFDPAVPEGTDGIQSVTTPFYATSGGPGFCAADCGSVGC